MGQAQVTLNTRKDSDLGRVAEAPRGALTYETSTEPAAAQGQMAPI